MRFVAALSAISAVAVAADRLPLDQGAEPNISLYAPEITVLEPSKAYVVKLDCPGCPFAIKETNTEVHWQQPAQGNAMVRRHYFFHIAHSNLTVAKRLKLSVETFDSSPNPALLLNGRRILPLDPMPLHINAGQIPANITMDDMTLMLGGPTTSGASIPLQYEHTVLRTEESGQLWIQFDVTGLPLSESNDPRFPYLGAESWKLEGEDRKLVQLMVRQQNETSEMFIEDIQVVARKDRAQPYRMKCGRLAMVQTTFDPAEWDEYGRFGTSERMQNLVVGKFGDFWFNYVQHSMLLLPFSILLAAGVVMLRSWYLQRKMDQDTLEDDAEIALLSSEYEDAPPAYADIPVIKIEEYD